MNGRNGKTSAVPWWAAFGAPLMGVPVLVVVLALGAAGKVEAGVGTKVVPVQATEQVEAAGALGLPVELPAEDAPAAPS